MRKCYGQSLGLDVQLQMRGNSKEKLIVETPTVASLFVRGDHESQYLGYCRKALGRWMIYECSETLF